MKSIIEFITLEKETCELILANLKVALCVSIFTTFFNTIFYVAFEFGTRISNRLRSLSFNKRNKETEKDKGYNP